MTQKQSSVRLVKFLIRTVKNFISQSFIYCFAHGWLSWIGSGNSILLDPRRFRSDRVDAILSVVDRVGAVLSVVVRVGAVLSVVGRIDAILYVVGRVDFWFRFFKCNRSYWYITALIYPNVGHRDPECGQNATFAHDVVTARRKYLTRVNVKVICHIFWRGTWLKNRLQWLHNGATKWRSSESHSEIK